jgi:arylsulfatase A-like enzyme
VVSSATTGSWYEAYREQVFQRQKQLGILPPGAELSPINPYAQEKSHDGRSWPEVDTVRPWESLSEGEKALFCRMAEVYAGFLSHADHHIGRLLNYLEESGQLDNTIVVLVSDNGASGEGGPNGSVNENKFFNGIPDDIEENLKYLEVLGSPETYNHYPTGWTWAFNTPFKLWKRYNFEGGVADPLIVSWPKGVKAGASCATSTTTPPTSCPPSTTAWGSSCPPRSRATRSSRWRARASATASRMPTRPPRGDRVLHHARLPCDLAQGLEGGHRGAGGAGRLARPHAGPLGAV